MTTRFLTYLLLSSTAVGAMAQQPQTTQPHGFYDSPFEVEFVPTEGDTLFEHCHIRYTLDGSAPTSKSPLYTAALQVSHNTLLRAVYERADTLASPITTVTYLFMDDVVTAPDVPEGYPSQWGYFTDGRGVAPGDYGMDPELMADPTFAQCVKEGLLALPTLSIVTDKDNLFNREYDPDKGGIYIYTGAPVGQQLGRDWVRPISMELFGGPADHDLTVDCGTKIHGGHSRLPEKSPKHSFRLMFAEKYGGPGKLHYKVFGKGSSKKYNQLTLRCMFGNTWQHWDGTNRSRAQYERDMWMRTMQQLMGHPSARGLYVNLYLNGMYWGIYNIAERVNDYYCSSNFGGEKENYDVLKVDESHSVVLSDGNFDKWNRMMAQIDQLSNSNKTTARQAYCRLRGCDEKGKPSEDFDVLLDVENFIDYMLLNYYAGNDDWDHHNWLAFSNRADRTSGFRFICWDTEIIFTTNDYNALGKNNKGCPTYMFQQLMKVPAFAHLFYDRVYQYLETEGGLLTPTQVTAVWDSLYHIIEKPLYAESARWGDYRRDVHPYTSNSWTVYRPDDQYQTERNRLVNKYFPQRTATFVNQLKDKGYYTKVTPPTLRVNGVNVAQVDTLHYGDIVQLVHSEPIYYTLDGTEPYNWDTSDYGLRTENSLVFSADDNLLSQVDWSAGALTVKAIVKDFPNFSPTVEWHFVLDGAASIATLHDNENSGLGATYDLMGRRIDPTDVNLSTGLYIRNGKKLLVK